MIRAVDDDDNRSEAVSISAGTIDSDVPGAVRDLTAIGEEGRATVTWINPNDADLGYVEMIYSPNDGDPSVTVREPVSGVAVPGGMVRRTIEGLSSGVVYTIVVRAYDDEGLASEPRSVEVVSGVPGSMGNPYLIDSASELQSIAGGFSNEQTNGALSRDASLAAHYRVIATIRLSGTFTSIGNAVRPFSGAIDGGGYTVRNLKSDTGLFGGVSGTVRDVHLVNAEVTVSGSGTRVAGALVGTLANGGIVSDSSATGGVIRGRATNSSDRLGGLVGESGGRVESSYATVRIEGAGGNGDRLGGLVGVNSGTIVNGYATGEVNLGAGSGYAGGLIGLNGSGARVLDTYAVGNIGGSNNDDRLGGLVGRNDGDVSRSFAVGNVDGQGGRDAVGALSGSQGSGTITNGYYNSEARISGEEVNSQGSARSSSQLLAGASEQFNGFAEEDWSFTVGALPSVKNKTDGVILGGQPIRSLSLSPYGDGSASNPWLIDSAVALQSIATGNSGNHPGGAAVTQEQALSGYYRVSRDIELGRFGNITPIGNSARGFTGTFDGDGNTISNLRITATSGGVWGLFGVIGSGGQVYNVELSQPQVTINGDAIGHAGSLVGINRGLVRDCMVRGGSVTNNRTNGQGERSGVGGLVGLNDGGATVERSHIAETIGVGSGHNLALGGLAGVNRGTVTESSARTTINGETKVYAGGLIGHNTGTVDKTFAIGNVKAYRDSYIGGLIGEHEGTSARLTHSYSSTMVTGADTNLRIGNLIGRSNGHIEDNYTIGHLDIRPARTKRVIADVTYYNDRDDEYDFFSVRGGGLVGEKRGGQVINSYYTKQGVELAADVSFDNFSYTAAAHQSGSSGSSYESAFVSEYRDHFYSESASANGVLTSTVKSYFSGNISWLLNDTGTPRETCALLRGQTCDPAGSSCQYGPYRDWDDSVWSWGSGSARHFPLLLAENGTQLSGQQFILRESNQARMLENCGNN